MLKQAQQRLFFDPSDTLRLWFTDYRPARRAFRVFHIRRDLSDSDWRAVNHLYYGRGMLPVDRDAITPRHLGGTVYWPAEDERDNHVIGTVMGLIHTKAFYDPEGGSSFWCLTADLPCTCPGVGEALVGE